MKRLGQVAVGMRFGSLLVVSLDTPSTQHKSIWKCICDCGKTRNVRGHNLLTGNTKSCGCVGREKLSKRSLIHGHARSGMSAGRVTPEYCAWTAMKQRCSNPKCHAFKTHGGRGIRVCERWLNSFKNFLDDMGLRPSRFHSLDRYPDQDGNYEPGNCRWATTKEQARNTRRVKLDIDTAAAIRVLKGRMTGAQVARDFKVSETTVYRIWYGQLWA